MLSAIMVDSVSKIFCIGFFYLFPLIITFLQPKKILVIAYGYGHGHSSGPWSLCQNKPRNVLPHPYTNISSGFSCAPIWNNFVLSFVQSRDNITTIMLAGEYTSKWVGIGFSKDGKMIGSSAMVGWVSEDGKSSIKQYYLEGNNVSQVTPDKGDLKLTEITPVVSRRENIIYLAFQVKSATKLVLQPIVLAVGDGIPTGKYLTKHVDKHSTSVDFSSGDDISSTGAYMESPETTKMIHGVMGIIGWGTVIPIGAIIPRHFKHRDPFWFYCHSTLNFIGFSIGLASVCNGNLIVDRVEEEEDPAVRKWVIVHRNIGVALVVVATIQILTFIVKSHKDPDTKSYKFWFLYHRWVGVLMILTGYVNIVFGIRIGKANIVVRIIFGIAVAGCFVTAIGLEVWTWIRGGRHKNKVHDEHPVFKVDPDHHDPLAPPPALEVVAKDKHTF